MFINFIYKNNTFTFNVKKEVSITYLKNLASKMIQKDKESFDLFYNNTILSFIYSATNLRTSAGDKLFT